MAKPSSENRYIRECVEHVTVSGYTFALMENGSYEYIIRVFPHNDDYESFWLEGGPWETFSGAKASILNFLSDEFEE